MKRIVIALIAFSISVPTFAATTQEQQQEVSQPVSVTASPAAHETVDARSYKDFNELLSAQRYGAEETDKARHERLSQMLGML